MQHKVWLYNFSSLKKNFFRCDDFYEFACGNFLTTTKIPVDQIEESTFRSTKYELDSKLRDIIEAPIHENEIEPFRNVKILYKACMDRQTIEIVDQSPISEIIANWPVVVGESWTPGEWNWTHGIADAVNDGFAGDYFFQFEISSRYINSTRNVIIVSYN